MHSPFSWLLKVFPCNIPGPVCHVSSFLLALDAFFCPSLLPSFYICKYNIFITFTCLPQTATQFISILFCKRVTRILVMTILSDLPFNSLVLTAEPIFLLSPILLIFFSPIVKFKPHFKSRSCLILLNTASYLTTFYL